MTRADTRLARVSLLSPDNNITGLSGVKSPPSVMFPSPAPTFASLYLLSCLKETVY